MYTNGVSLFRFGFACISREIRRDAYRGRWSWRDACAERKQWLIRWRWWCDGDDDDDEQRVLASRRAWHSSTCIYPRVRALCLFVCVLCKFWRCDEWKSYSEVALCPFQLRRSYDAGAANKIKNEDHFGRKERKKKVTLVSPTRRAWQNYYFSLFS